MKGVYILAVCHSYIVILKLYICADCGEAHDVVLASVSRHFGPRTLGPKTFLHHCRSVSRTLWHKTLRHRATLDQAIPWKGGRLCLHNYVN